MVKIWKDCIKEPSELGKKVLCQRNGDFYVAMRFEDFYIPVPFADHYHGIDLCKPQTWCEIDFPKPYTGYIKVIPPYKNIPITMEEAKKQYPESYWNIALPLINSIGKIPKPESGIS